MVIEGLPGAMRGAASCACHQRSRSCHAGTGKSSLLAYWSLRRMQAVRQVARYCGRAAGQGSDDFASKSSELVFYHFAGCSQESTLVRIALLMQCGAARPLAFAMCAGVADAVPPDLGHQAVLCAGRHACPSVRPACSTSRHANPLSRRGSSAMRTMSSSCAGTWLASCTLVRRPRRPFCCLSPHPPRPPTQCWASAPPPSASRAVDDWWWCWIAHIACALRTGRRTLRFGCHCLRCLVRLRARAWAVSEAVATSVCGARGAQHHDDQLYRPRAHC